MEHLQGARAEEFNCATDAADGILCRAFARREELAREKNNLVKPGVRRTELYAFTKQELSKAKREGFRTQTFSAHFLGEQIRAVPRFRNVHTRQLSAVIKALVEEGFLQPLPTKPGKNYSSTYTFT